MSASAASTSAPREGHCVAALAAADGFAVGRSLRFRWSASTPTGKGPHGAPLREAVAQVRRELQRVLGTLPRAQAELFEPELQILDEIEPRLLAHDEEGRSREDAVVAATSCGCTDLVIDLRVRLLHALESTPDVDLHAMAGRHEADVVLLTDLVTPTLVASLPSQVIAVVAGIDGGVGPRRDVGRLSHAAILARGRGLPLVYVQPGPLASIPDGVPVIVTAREGGASLWVDPNAHRLAAARRQMQRIAAQRLRDAASCGTLAHLGVEVRVNVATSLDSIPDAADGVGLVRTEMMFAGHLTAPSESEQLEALLLVAARARGRPIVVRLFDAAADKPLPWLGGATGASRGIERLLAYPEVFSTQLRVLARAREHADFRVLLPFVRTTDAVNAVRRWAAPTLPVGAMIESPDGAEAAESIAAAADFVSIGTNDLTATALGLERAASVPRSHPKLLALVRRVIAAAHARGRRATICGEMAGDEHGARVAVGLGADVVSVAPAQLSAIRRALSRTSARSCRAAARASLADRTALASNR